MRWRSMEFFSKWNQRDWIRINEGRGQVKKDYHKINYTLIFASHLSSVWHVVDRGPAPAHVWKQKFNSCRLFLLYKWNKNVWLRWRNRTEMAKFRTFSRTEISWGKVKNRCSTAFFFLEDTKMLLKQLFKWILCTKFYYSFCAIPKTGTPRLTRRQDQVNVNLIQFKACQIG